MAEGELFHVFCDESRQTQDRFMVFGGIMVRDARLTAMEEAISMWRDAQRMHAELKWSKVSNQKAGEYESLVDLFFAFAGKSQLHFRSVVFDTSQIDYRAHHKNNRELGFYKFYYQFLLHCFCKQVSQCGGEIVVHLDERTTKYKLSILCNVLNNGIRKKYNEKRRVVRNVQAVCSHDWGLMQIADVLMGAIGHQNNDCQLRPSARRAKIELADYIARKAKLLSLRDDTPWSMKHFGIWRFRFGAGKKKAP